MNPRPARPVRDDALRCARNRAKWWFGAVVVCGAVGGCHGNQQAYRDLYYREMRLQEDEIYRLEDCIHEYQQIIRGYRVEVEELKAKLAEQQVGATTDGAAGVDGSRSLLDPRNGGIEPRPEDQEPQFRPPGIDIPQIDPGEPADPGDLPTTPPADEQSGEDENDEMPPGVPEISVPPVEQRPPPDEPLDLPAGEPGELPPLEGTDPLGEAPEFVPAPSTVSAAGPVAEISIASYLGPGMPSGEATLIALLEPLDESGEPTHFHGEASLMLRDPSSGEDGEKVVRWDFTSGEVADSWREDLEPMVLDLAVVLPEDAPRDRKLELWVRLVDDSGGKALSKMELTLGQLASIDQAELAQRSPPPADGGVAHSGATPGAWRTSTRPPALAEARPANSGWQRSNAAPLPHDTVEPAAFHAPPKARPVPRAADVNGAPPQWSPDRTGP